MKRLLLILMALAALLPLAPTAHSQGVIGLQADTTEPVGGIVTADDTSVALLIRFVGSVGTTTTQSGTVQVSSGDVLLKVGAITAEAADATVTGCGATPGTLDVDTSPCTTLGGLIDRINASANWVAVALDGLRTDSTAGAKLLTLAATRATTAAGIALTWDTSVAFHDTIALIPSEARSMVFYTGGAGATNNLQRDPWSATRTAYCFGNHLSTYGSGTSNIVFYSTKETLNGSGTGAAVTTTLYSEPGGASTVAKALDYRDVCLWNKKGEKMLVRILNSAAMSVVTDRAFGYQIRFRPPAR